MKIKIFCSILMVLPVIAYAQSDPIARAILIERTLSGLEVQMQNFFLESQNIPMQDIGRYITAETAVRPNTHVPDKRMDVNLEERNRVIEKILHDISVELTLEYMVGVQGEQIFELIDSQGVIASRLEYPHRGEMLIFKGEVGFLSKVFLGGRYGSSQFRKKICSDEDWNLWDPTWPFGTDQYVDYQISRQLSKSKVEFFDVNLYYRFLDLDKDEVKQRRLSSEEDTIFDYLLVDSLSLDIFTGYQQQKGRYGMIDPMEEILRYDEGAWYYAVGLPADVGLNSFYKIEYKGPRIGLRAEGSKGKVTSRVSFAYAWLETKAYGWWNLRDLTYWQSGKNGYGIDVALEVMYRFTSSLSAGLGYNYLYCRQERLKMYAVEEGVPWWEGYQDRIRNAESEIGGFSFILRFIW